MDSLPILVKLKSFRGSLTNITGPDRFGEFYGNISCKNFILPNVNIANFAKILLDLSSNDLVAEGSGWIEGTDCTLRACPKNEFGAFLLQIMYGDFIVYEINTNKNDIKHDSTSLLVFTH